MALEKGLAVTGHEGNKEVVVATKGSTSTRNGRTVLCLCRGASDPQMDGQFCAFAVVLDTQTHMGGKCHRTKHTHTQVSARDTGDIRTVCVDGTEVKFVAMILSCGSLRQDLWENKVKGTLITLQCFFSCM